MTAGSRWKRLVGGGLLLAVLAAAGGLHHHEDLFGSLTNTPGGTPPLDRIVSGHSPLSASSHWHSGKRVLSDPCLACHLHRVAALRKSLDLFPRLSVVLNSEVPRRAVPIPGLRLSEPARGPPSVS